MARRLTANIVLADPKTGSPVVFEAGEKVPRWAADLITNESLFVQDSDPAEKAEPKSDAPKQPAPAAGTEGASGDGDDDEGETNSDGTPPPKTGRGSGDKAWRAYAASKGFEFDEDVKRDEIIAGLTAENVATE